MKYKSFQQHDIYPTRIHIATDFLEKEEFHKMKLLVKEDKKLIQAPEFEKKIMMHMGIICDNLGVDLASYESVEITETFNFSYISILLFPDAASCPISAALSNFPFLTTTSPLFKFSPIGLIF